MYTLNKRSTTKPLLVLAGTEAGWYACISAGSVGRDPVSKQAVDG